MDKKVVQKNTCPDCTFCQLCCDSRCAMCRVPNPGKKKEGNKSKIHKPLFLKY